MAGNYPLLDTQAIQLQCRETGSFLGSISTRKTELTLHEVCNLSFSPAGPDVFESQARKQKKKRCHVSSQHDGNKHLWSAQSIHVLGANVLPYALPSPDWALPQDEGSGAGAREVTSTAVVGVLAY